MTISSPLFKTQYFRDRFREAVDYYHERAGFDVAERFITVVEHAVQLIQDNPQIGPRYIPPDGFEELENLQYRYLPLGAVSPFPYTIYYELEDERIILHALYHDAQERERLLTGLKDDDN